MHLGRPTLQTFLAQQLVGADHQHQLAALLSDVAAAVTAIAQMTTRGALGGYLGAHGALNSQGERQQRLDVLAHEVMLDTCQRSGSVAAMASEEIAQPVLADNPASGPYLLLFDPLDGSSNIDVNAPIGSIFSVLKRPHLLTPDAADFLQPGQAQVAAGYAIYGPSTMLVLTVGRGAHGFTLDCERNQFTLTHADLRIPEQAHEFAINTSNQRFWEAPVQRYVSECQAGADGVRGRDFNMRWVAALVADAHRILTRGGVFLYPRDSRVSSPTAAARPSPPEGVGRVVSGPAPARSHLNAGRLRLLYEANPVAWLVEQAGGRAITGRERLLDLMPGDLHQRVPVVFGSRDEVERIERYHHEHDRGTDQPYVSPLFNERSLFRAQELV